MHRNYLLDTNNPVFWESFVKTIPDSGFTYPNNFIRNFLLSLENVAGQNGVKTILNMAGQSDLICNYPPANMEGRFDVARYSMIMATLDDLYGDKGAQLMATRAGYANFKASIASMGDPLGVNTESFQSKPVIEKVESALAMVHSMATRTKTTSIPRTKDGQFLYPVERCPVCYGRTTSTPRCFITAGLLQEAIRWATGGLNFDVKQVRARSCGDASCDYVIPLTPNN
jgi:predicted hydrocarbon binding protein